MIPGILTIALKSIPAEKLALLEVIIIPITALSAKPLSTRASKSAALSRFIIFISFSGEFQLIIAMPSASTL